MILRDNNIQGKKILLLGPSFYGYCKLISDELIRQGALVTYAETYIFLEQWRNNKNFFDWFFRYVRNPGYRVKHTNDILKIIGDEAFDIVFAVSVYSPTKTLLSVLKKRNSNLKTYIYFWDAFSTWNFAYQMRYFNYRFSFDSNDCNTFKKYNLHHQPLFYTEASNNVSFKYDLVHIGSLHPKYKRRATMVAQLYDQAKKMKLSTYIHLVFQHSNIPLKDFSFKYQLKYLFSREYRSYLKEVMGLYSKYSFISITPLSLLQVNEIEKEARCIVDINIDRSGVAMRVISALAAGKKIITNNRYIVNETFYNPANISIIDERNVQIDADFLNIPYQHVDMGYLRLDNWIKTILNKD